MSENCKQLFDSFEQKLNIVSDDFDCLTKVAKSMIQKVEDEKTSNENMIKEYKKYDVVDSDIVKLNVGGTLFLTHKSTLVKKIKDEEGELYLPNMFEGLLNGFVKPKYYDKAIFIDRNPKYFSYILDYLRMANTDCEFEIPANVDKYELKKEAKFYNIQGLVEMTEPFSNGITSSIIDKNQVKDLIRLCEFSSKSNWNFLYRATEDGFQAQNFHTYCDDHSNTLTIIQSSNGYVFGGFTTQPWDGTCVYKADVGAFLFSLVNRKKLPIKLKLVEADGQNAIYCYSSYGPTFGNFDLYICDHSNDSNSSYSDFGKVFKCENFVYGTYDAHTLLAGSYNFKVSEIEVFQKVDS